MNYLTNKNIKIPRNPKSHKGDNGKVLVIGGSKDYVGALALAGLAALRSGADLVTIAAPEKAGWAVNALSPDLIVKKFKGNNFNKSQAKDILKLSNNFDTVLIGNGIGMRAKSFCKKFVKECKKPMVIDADAVKAISLDIVNNSILTPHAKELEILLQNSKINKKIIKKIINEKNINKKVSLLKSLKIKNNIILLKGPIDIIISRNKTAFNKTGNAGMTKAGTGDVLAGLCAGYLAQTNNLFQSACNAAYISGLIGDILLKKKKGFTYLASDMVEEIKKLKLTSQFNEVLKKKNHLILTVSKFLGAIVSTL